MIPGQDQATARAEAGTDFAAPVLQRKARFGWGLLDLSAAMDVKLLQIASCSWMPRRRLEGSDKAASRTASSATPIARY